MTQEVHTFTEDTKMCWCSLYSLDSREHNYWNTTTPNSFLIHTIYDYQKMGATFLLPFKKLSVGLIPVFHWCVTWNQGRVKLVRYWNFPLFLWQPQNQKPMCALTEYYISRLTGIGIIPVYISYRPDPGPLALSSKGWVWQTEMLEDTPHHAMLCYKVPPR